MNFEKHQSNFYFLNQEYPILANLSQSAEYHLHTDAGITLYKLRQFVEKMTEWLFKVHFLDFPYKDSLHHRLNLLEEEDILPERVARLMHTIKHKGNIAVHQRKADISTGNTVLLAAFSIAKWFVETYGEEIYDISQLRFSPPPNMDARHALHVLKQEYSQLEENFERLKKEQKKLSDKAAQELKVKAYKAAKKIKLSEAETRAIIDEQLQKAGWEADTIHLSYAKGIRPQKGRNIAIAEWRINGKRADYALFIGLELYGLVEAKKKQKEVISDLQQAKHYAKAIQGQESFDFLDEWRGYKVPFLFATNSRPFHAQLATKSGTWFVDVRQTNNHPKALRGWYSPRDLKELYKQNIAEAETKLEIEPFNYLINKDGLGLRYYQVEAIKAVEDKITNADTDNRKALIAMATGTGKTRTIIGLCYRLIKSKRFKRILFLVDRNVLGQQAVDSFNEVRIEGFDTFKNLYDLKEMKDKLPEEVTKIHFATVQSMVKRILYAGEGQEIPAVGTYDCIIVDEAHRGYILDREMDEDEVDFKNQNDFVSKYKAVLDYFDAFRVGLTATPALHTTQVFGKPVYKYSYRQAVIDGYLIDHEPPYDIQTALRRNGIVWKEGEKPQVYDRQKGETIDLDELEDELKIEVEGFNKAVITDNFNRVVAEELTNHLDPTSEEKTLIFAASDEHADKVVLFLKKAFEDAGVEVDDDAIVKITGSVYKPPQQVINYKNEKFPNIVVTVDLLTTGVDVPEITNLVFLRRVKSRILYDQMLGRATRLCDRIGKEVFKIYDPVGLYDTLQEVTEMRPVVVNPNTTFEQLFTELENIDEQADTLGIVDREKLLKKQIEQLTAKIQRKKKTVNEKNENTEHFKLLSGGQTPDEFIKTIRALKPVAATQKIKQHRALFRLLDEMKGIPKYQYISHHEDRVEEVKRGYGKKRKPADYLEDLKTFLTENRNQITAIDIICTRPKELTRQSLQELQLLLSQSGYTNAQIKTAWQQTTNEEIAADIISYIRTLTMGTTLETPKERIEKAFNKLYQQREWTKIQRNWLERIRNKLLEDTILDDSFFEKEPFKSDGGYRRLNKIFKDDFGTVVEMIKDNMFPQVG